jgi:mevalonate kinase
MNETQTYYSNGKLLLTAEYFVLKGAKSIALPIRFGQSLKVSEAEHEDELSWKAYADNRLWFSARFKLPDFNILQTTDKTIAIKLVDIFREIKTLKTASVFDRALEFETNLNFKPEWGFGSSSTLISNLSEWAAVDPFQLNELIFKGSGFDIACASAAGPVLFQREKSVKPVTLNYSFKKQLHFVYLGSKKSTQPAVEDFLENGNVTQTEIDKMNLISESFVEASTLEEFQNLMVEHENMVSKLLQIEPIKQQRFFDFPGEIKSLGAWGGDFILAASDLNTADVKSYFKRKNLKTVFSWNELILDRN